MLPNIFRHDIYEGLPAPGSGFRSHTGGGFEGGSHRLFKGYVYFGRVCYLKSFNGRPDFLFTHHFHSPSGIYGQRLERSFLSIDHNAVEADIAAVKAPMTADGAGRKVPASVAGSARANPTAWRVADC